MARFWYHFGSILAPSWVTLGAFGHPMGTFGTLWGAFGTPFRSLDPSWRLLQSLMSSLGRFSTRFRIFSEVYSVCSIKITSLSQPPRCGNIRRARNPHHKTWPRLRRRRGRRPQDVHGNVCKIHSLRAYSWHALQSYYQHVWKHLHEAGMCFILV